MMKAGWERMKEQISPDINTVRKMLMPFFEEDKVEYIEMLSGGLNNSNIKVTTSSNEDFVLRLYGSNNKSMKVECEIVKLLKGRVPVAEIVYSDSSCSVFQSPFLLMKLVRGEQLSEMIYRENAHEIRSAAAAAGAALAEIHKMKFPASGFFDDQLNIREYVEISASSFMAIMEEIYRRGYVSKHLGEKVCGNVLKFSQEHACILDGPEEQNFLVHSDFNPLNILVEEKDGSIKISAILDWEYAFSGPPLMDIGNMLRYEGIDTSMLMPFILSYQENGGNLPDKWLQKAKLLDLIALFDLVDHEECGEVKVADIKRLILSMMDEWESYGVIQNAFK
ncbi:phosphotransferase [Mangrovibacillus sp. Mu-81]|jgi:aminoglycoside phosphotransferase (APT) family kinase protein|uniref:phosphotransferase family protein n=1 Tax=Mangrovibacillus sp. Mu-81 TaxID=3121478 RepID=UPI002FE492AE